MRRIFVSFLARLCADAQHALEPERIAADTRREISSTSGEGHKGCEGEYMTRIGDSGWFFEEHYMRGYLVGCSGLAGEVQWDYPVGQY